VHPKPISGPKEAIVHPLPIELIQEASNTKKVVFLYAARTLPGRAAMINEVFPKKAIHLVLRPNLIPETQRVPINSRYPDD
jgi:hypothetical protein